MFLNTKYKKDENFPGERKRYSKSQVIQKKRKGTGNDLSSRDEGP